MQRARSGAHHCKRSPQSLPDSLPPHPHPPPGYCPSGDDPLTLCATTHTRSYQELRFTLGSRVAWDPTDSAAAPTYAAWTEAMDYFGTGNGVGETSARSSSPGSMRLEFESALGGRLVAHAAGSVFGLALPTSTAAANDALEAALETLPQRAVKDVQVSSVLTSSSVGGGLDGVLERRYVVTFVPDAATSANVGAQAPLRCESGYTCTEAGCQPVVAMPFLYRYAGMDTDARIGSTLTTAGATGSGNVLFYSGSRNGEAAWLAGSFVRLHANSQPQMPFNVPVDGGVSAAALARYDLRILVAVIDPANSLDDAADTVYVRVTAGHTNITSNLEAIGYAGWPTSPAYAGVWGAIAPVSAASPAKPWTTTLSGFTPLGPIVMDAAGEFKMNVPGAPGAALHFAKANIVANDGWGRWFEVLIKLPSCTVTPLTLDGQFNGLDGSTLYAVDAQVENVECSNRGACNRDTGLCKVRREGGARWRSGGGGEGAGKARAACTPLTTSSRPPSPPQCSEGYYGPACSRQTVLV